MTEQSADLDLNTIVAVLENQRNQALGREIALQVEIARRDRTIAAQAEQIRALHRSDEIGAPAVP